MCSSAALYTTQSICTQYCSLIFNHSAALLHRPCRLTHIQTYEKHMIALTFSIRDAEYQMMLHARSNLALHEAMKYRLFISYLFTQWEYWVKNKIWTILWVNVSHPRKMTSGKKWMCGHAIVGTISEKDVPSEIKPGPDRKCPNFTKQWHFCHKGDFWVTAK